MFFFQLSEVYILQSTILDTSMTYCQIGQRLIQRYINCKIQYKLLTINISFIDVISARLIQYNNVVVLPGDSGYRWREDSWLRRSRCVRYGSSCRQACTVHCYGWCSSESMPPDRAGCGHRQ